MKATYTLAGEAKEAAATDSTTVIKGQIRLSKKAAVLPDACKTDNDAPVDYSAIKSEAEKSDLSFGINGGDVKPGSACVVWQIIATNEGDAEAQSVTIRDAAPAFTTLVAGSAHIAKGNGEVVSGASGTDVVFNVGEDAEKAPGKGGTLKPGESVEVRFTVKVN